MSSANHLLAASSHSPSTQNSPSHTTSPSFSSTFPPHQPMNKVLQAAIANTSMASYMSQYSRTSTESGSAFNDSLVVPSFDIHALGDTINEESFDYQSLSPSKNETSVPPTTKLNHQPNLQIYMANQPTVKTLTLSLMPLQTTSNLRNVLSNPALNIQQALRS